ncbi:hypothetical protein [Bdellovibrio sp. KM01]|uniref:hypothetical protein n=1 Tax=Bdellovibrio sp. KM01 TaxID=2748865 RepID=UPI0015E942E6|nr:hypothetical protein [Bdellovibrio sp. KM01]QLY26694.1 hypothetical protein HW988_06705 [Bdellovibrio sp. KM01]
MKFLLSIALVSMTLPAFADTTLVTCSPQNGSKRLQVSITDDGTRTAHTIITDSRGNRIESDKEVHSVYANGYTAYESADHEFYLVVNQSYGNSKLVLTDAEGGKSTADLYCNLH